MVPARLDAEDGRLGRLAGGGIRVPTGGCVSGIKRLLLPVDGLHYPAIQTEPLPIAAVRTGHFLINEDGSFTNLWEGEVHLNE